MSLRKFFIISIIAVIFALLMILILPGKGVIYSYTLWRSSAFIGQGFLMIFINNLIVVLLVLFGGVLFSRVEINSYKKFPRKFYSFLDWLTTPLHKFFAIFDKRMEHLEQPSRSCYFLLVSFPVMVLFFNVFLFSALIMLLIMEQGQSAINNVIKIIPIALIEFSSILIAALIAYEFSQKAIPILMENNIPEFIRISDEYLHSRKNWIIMLMLSFMLLIGAHIEDLMIR